MPSPDDRRLSVTLWFATDPGSDNAIQRRSQLMTDGGQEHRFDWLACSAACAISCNDSSILRAKKHPPAHKWPRFHYDSAMDEADLQIGIVAGQDINKIDCCPQIICVSRWRSSCVSILSKYAPVRYLKY